jgi:hypothetical protein
MSVKITYRSFHPMEWDIASQELIGYPVVCAMSKEGLGVYGILVGVQPYASKPYICKLYREHSLTTTIRRYSWIGVTGNATRQLSNSECQEIVDEWSVKTI